MTSTTERFPTADAAFADACREYIRGCTCASVDNPQECEECTKAFVEAVLERARDFGLVIGSGSIKGLLRQRMQGEDTNE